MDSYLTQTIVQINATLYCSLFFTALTVLLQRNVPKKNTLISLWYIMSIVIGIFSFLASYALLEAVLELSPASASTSIDISFSFAVFLAFLQLTCFINGYFINLYYFYHPKKYDLIENFTLNNDNETYAIKITSNRLAKSIMWWFLLCIVILIVPGAVYGGITY